MPSKAEEKRLKYLEDAPKVPQRTLDKAASITMGLPSFATLSDDELKEAQNDLAREAAKKARWTPEKLPQELTSRQAPQKVVEAAKEALTGESKPHWFVRGLDWVTTQLDRGTRSATARNREAREVGKEREQEYIDKGIDPSIARLKAAADALMTDKRVFQAGVKGAKDPKTVPNLLTLEETDLSTEKTIKLPFGIKLSPAQLASTGLQLPFDIGLDLTNYLGIKPLAKAVKNAQGRVLKGKEAGEALAKNVEEAKAAVIPAKATAKQEADRLARLKAAQIKAEKLAKQAETKLTSIVKKSENITKTKRITDNTLAETIQNVIDDNVTSAKNLEAKIFELNSKLTTKQKTLNDAIQEANRIRREAALSPTKRLGKMAARTGEQLAEKAPITPKQAETLNEGIKKLQATLAEQQAKLSKVNANIADIEKAASGEIPLESLESIPTNVKNLITKSNKAADTLQELEKGSRVLVRRTITPGLLSPKLAQAITKVQDATAKLSEAKRGLQAAEETAKPTWAVTFRGNKVASIDNVAKALKEASRTATLRSPALSRIGNITAKTVKPFTPLYRIGSKAVTPEQHRATEGMLRDVYPEIREAVTVSVQEGRKRLQDWADKGVPKDARELASSFSELPAEEQQFFLAKLAPETRDFVQQAETIWTTSRAEITQKLVDEFGDDFAERLIANYVPHITQASKEEIEKFLTDWAEKMGRDRVPGSKPSFMYERLDPEILIKDLEEAGLNPVKDLAVIDATYRATAERMLALKQTTNWLEEEGFVARAFKDNKGKVKYFRGEEPIRKASLEGWEDGGKLFPWLKETKIHPDVARAFSNLKPTIEFNQPEIAALAKVFNTVTSTFKAMVTSMRPIFHFINQVGNMILMRMAGIPYATQTKYYEKTITGFLKPSQVDKDIIEMFERYGLRGQGMFTDAVQVTPEIAKEMENELQKLTGGVLGKIKAVVMPKTAPISQVPFETGRWFGEQVDTVSRMAAFRYFLDEGIEPSQAAELVKRYMFDYSMLTPTERTARQWVIPFYSWARYSLPRSILATVEQPGAYTGMFRTQEALSDIAGVDQDQLPGWLQTAMILGQDEEGKVVYVNPQPPWSQFPGSFGAEANVGRDIFGMLNPLYSVALMSLLKRDPETGKEILTEADKLKSSPEQVAKLVYESLKKVTPIGEFEKLFPEQLAPDKTTLVGRPVKGLAGYPISFLSSYDQPLAEAFKQLRAEDVLDTYKKVLEEQGVITPTTAQVQGVGEDLAKAEGAITLVREMTKDPKKMGLVLTIAGSSNAFKGLESTTEQLDWLVKNVLLEHSDLFAGSAKEIAQRLLKIFTKENYTKLVTRLERGPTPYDFLAYRTFLESGKEATSPGVNKLVDTIKRFNLLQEVKTGAPNL